jgi:hypothetical protein
MKVESYDELCKSQGFEHTGDSVVENLKKALSNTNSGPGGIQSGPLMLENLDGLMTEVLLTNNHFKLFNSIPRIPSAQPYFEWNRHKGFGSRRGNLGFSEGGAPKGSISSFERNGLYNKYLGVKGGVTHQMLVSGMNGGSVVDPTTQENKDRALEMFERLEREFVFGDKSIADENGNEVNFDGLLTHMEANAPEQVVDMAGAALGFDHLDDSIESLVTKGKCISVDGFKAFMNTHVTTGLNQQYQDRNIVRHNKDGAQGGQYTPGFKLPGYDSQFGHLEFEHTILLEEVEGSVPVDAALGGAPAAPATCVGVAGANVASGLVAETYYYSVAAFNDTGESMPKKSIAVAVAADQEVVVTAANVAGATGYRVYRGFLADGSDAKWIARIAQDGANDCVYTDVNQYRTQTSAGKEENGLTIIFKPDPKDIAMSQMAPLTRMPLPQVDTTFPFLLLLYCVLVPKAAERIKIFKNCGRYVPA